MKPDFSGDYLNFASTKDGDVVTILTEGAIEHSETLKKDMFNIKVSQNDKEKKYSPNHKIGLTFQEAWGEDTKDWVGNKFTIMHNDKKMHVRPIVK